MSFLARPFQLHAHISQLELASRVLHSRSHACAVHGAVAMSGAYEHERTLQQRPVMQTHVSHVPHSMSCVPHFLIHVPHSMSYFRLFMSIIISLSL